MREQSNKQLNDIVSANLIVPDLVGDDFTYPNMQVYVQETYKEFTTKLEAFERLQEEVEPHMDNAVERFKQLEMESKLLTEKAKGLDQTITENEQNSTKKAEQLGSQI